MLNLLWGGMILIGILWGAFHGTLGAVTDQVLTGAKDAVSLCITMLGILSFWSGILEIGEQAGLLERFSRRLRPVLRFLFPSVPDGHPAQQAMATNIIANMLGLGWAATPAGLQAMEELSKLNQESSKAKPLHAHVPSHCPTYVTDSPSGGTASNAMCTFLILNMSSLQLIPINMIAYRSQYGSVNPASIVMPALLATAVSTLIGVIAAKILERIWPPT
ncbi:MAG: nucleoside recognition protein [Lachnospiraceae bacterium]|nr:nucleoside recognition protein [Lachnospiraceae bacterium]